MAYNCFILNLMSLSLKQTNKMFLKRCFVMLCSRPKKEFFHFSELSQLKTEKKKLLGMDRKSFVGRGS